ncbi:isocitrate lyase/phosphoenolpyruvate mutase family protein [Luteibacter sp. SG786]|uniref:isocitrate lyase/PEP mutase family protein n=1 Tax=Luteibacter sp. SG786 TaxID=2587130 RepID=UPI001420F94D|nr:isocitrate lyase/phosphoenolpyruvate mutase family protein [Luteibacter sp. SG786]NII55318.1 2-methylisocitrate lyase-like PEP mutase family enzyme [Luteibacter sp. SG786]
MNAQRLRDLHNGPALLVLPNAWDAASASVVQHAGASAVATTSAGVAWSCGWPDGDRLPAEEMLAALSRIVRVIDVPLTADIEEGCHDDPSAVASFVSRLVDAGVAGINIEDGNKDPALLAAKLRAIREALGQRDLYINARTDVFLRGMASGDAGVEEVLRRGALYRDAGADGLFVPGIKVIDEVRRVAAGIAPMPLNVMLVSGLPSRQQLFDAGARRLSAGIALSLEAYATAGRMAAELLEREAPDVGYGTLNEWLAR